MIVYKNTWVKNKNCLINRPKIAFGTHYHGNLHEMRANLLVWLQKTRTNIT